MNIKILPVCSHFRVARMISKKTQCTHGLEFKESSDPKWATNQVFEGYRQQGYTLAGALVLIAVLSIFMAMALPFWEKVKQREMEEELIFRGKEYMEAIGRYHAKFHVYPPDLETLEKQKFIRRLYKDPMTESGKWKVLRPDSLVETGAAGTINQPGQAGGMPRQGENEEGELEEGEIPQSPQRTGSQNTEEENEEQEEAEDNQGEEPESEVIGPVAGVVSRSKKTSMKLYNGQTAYNKWIFTFSPPQEQQRQQDGKDEKPGKNPKKPEKPKNPQNPNQDQNQNQDEDQDQE